MIRLENIHRLYNQQPKSVQALAEVNLTVEAGDFIAVTGASGSGKSTLLNILGCLDQPTSGRYFIRDRDLSTLDDRELSRVRNELFGFVFQQFHLLPRLSALKNVLLPLLYAQKYPSNAAEKGSSLLRSVGLGDKLSAKPGELSGGQQQRVAIARALINSPSIILADEPTGNLDRESGREILDIFKTLNQQGRTIILVTHDPDVAALTNRIITLEDGRIVSNRPST